VPRLWLDRATQWCQSLGDEQQRADDGDNGGSD
jgi:hypothetical protein